MTSLDTEASERRDEKRSHSGQKCSLGKLFDLLLAGNLNRDVGQVLNAMGHSRSSISCEVISLHIHDPKHSMAVATMTLNVKVWVEENVLIE